MSAISSLKYIGNGLWIYRGEQGAVVVAAADQPALNVLVKEGGVAMAEVSARIVDGVLTVEDFKKVVVHAANDNSDSALSEGAKVALGIMAGAVFTNPFLGVGAGIGYGGLVGILKPNPNANLDYAHEFNFEGSPYHQESNQLSPPQGPSVGISSELRELFNRTEIAYANGIGPDGLPWGTATEVAPNATVSWSLSPQPGYLTRTTEIDNGSGSVTRITETVDRRTGETQATYVHEDGRLVATTQQSQGQVWVINRLTGEMESAGAIGEPPASQPRPPSSALVNQEDTHTVTLNPGGTLSDIVLLQGRAGNPVTVADLLAANPQYSDVTKIPAGAELNVPVRTGDVLSIYRGSGAVETINTRTAEITSTTQDAQGNTHQVISRPDGDDGRIYIERTLHAGTGEVVSSSAVRVDTMSGQIQPACRGRNRLREKTRSCLCRRGTTHLRPQK